MSSHIFIAITHFFSLGRCDIANHGLRVRVILLVYFVSSLLEDPVILVVIVVTTLVHQILEYFAHVIVVGSLLELQISAVLQVSVEFFWETSGERLNGRRHLLVLDTVVLVVFVFTLQSLPWQISFQKVQQNEADGL